MNKTDFNIPVLQWYHEIWSSDIASFLFVTPESGKHSTVCGRKNIWKKLFPNWHTQISSQNHNVASAVTKLTHSVSSGCNGNPPNCMEILIHS